MPELAALPEPIDRHPIMLESEEPSMDPITVSEPEIMRPDTRLEPEINAVPLSITSQEDEQMYAPEDQTVELIL